MGNGCCCGLLDTDYSYKRYIASSYDTTQSDVQLETHSLSKLIDFALSNPNYYATIGTKLEKYTIKKYKGRKEYVDRYNAITLT